MASKKIPPYAVTFVVGETGGGSTPKQMQLLYANKTILDQRYYTQPEVDELLDCQLTSLYNQLYDSTAVLNVESTPTEIPIDSLPICLDGQSYPIPQSRGFNYASRHSRHVWETWETNYSRCRVKLTCETSGTIYTSPSTGFANKADLFTWINSVVPNNGSDVTDTTILSIYDEQSGDVPCIQKVRGVNSSYLGLTNARSGLKSTTKTAFSTREPDTTRSKIIAASEHFVNKGSLSTPITITQYDTAGEISKNVMWVPSRKRNLYGLPKLNSKIFLPDIVLPSPTRHWWSMSTNEPVIQTVADNDYHNLEDFCFITRVGSGTINAFRPDSVDIRTHLFEKSDMSILAVYLIKHSSDSNRYAFFAKPVGIDMIYVDWFDQSKYRLEAIATAKNRQPQLRYIPCYTSDSFDTDLFEDRTRVKKSVWMWDDFRPSQIQNVGFLKPRVIRFRLRRLSDNRVGPLSKAIIKPMVRTTNCLFKWMVC